MTDAAEGAPRGGWGGLLASAALARAFTIAVLGSVLCSFAIERIAGRVTYISIITGLCVIGFGMLIARRREISLVRLVPTTVVLFIAWALASVFWSEDGPGSLWSWLSLAGLAFLAVTIGHIRDTLQTVRALGDVMRVVLSISLGAEILSGILLDMPFPFLGIQGNIAQAGSIQGIFGTRNMLGFVAVIALITFLIEYRTQSVRVGVSIFSVVLAGGLAALSDSPTVLVLAVAVGAAVGALALVRHARPERRAALQLGLGTLVVVGLIVGYAARRPITDLLGAGTDFSMRVELWTEMARYLRSDPVLGWGWFGPWDQSQFPFSSINYNLRTNHATGLNAYLDVVLQLGWIGLILFIAFVGVALVRAWVDASERRSVIYAWTPLVLVTLLVESMFESFTLYGFGWLMLVLCAVRAGQSRSWRERIDATGGASPLPHVQGLPNQAG